MKKIDDQYCYLEPAFPAKAFIVILFLLDGDELVNIFPTYEMFTTLEQASTCVTDLVAVLKEEVPGIEIADVCSLLPMKFSSTYQLKPEYWHNPSIPFTSTERAKLFLPLVTNYDFYQLLI